MTSRTNELTTDSDTPYPMLTIIIVPVIIGVAVLFLSIGMGLGFLCGVNYSRCEMRCRSNNPSPQDDNVSSKVPGPIYEEVVLEDTNEAINLSKNLAYESTKKL